jgi:hypothetical protein
MKLVEGRLFYSSFSAADLEKARLYSVGDMNSFFFKIAAEIMILPNPVMLDISVILWFV